MGWTKLLLSWGWTHPASKAVIRWQGVLAGGTGQGFATQQELRPPHGGNSAGASSTSWFFSVLACLEDSGAVWMIEQCADGDATAVGHAESLHDVFHVPELGFFIGADFAQRLERGFFARGDFVGEVHRSKGVGSTLNRRTTTKNHTGHRVTIPSPSQMLPQLGTPSLANVSASDAL